MEHRDRLNGLDIVGWAALGAAAGIVAGFALSEWAGGVSRPRVERMVTRRPRQPARPALNAAETARAAVAALRADVEFKDTKLAATLVATGMVEVRGWVPSRAARARAARIVHAVPGIDTVINSILVRGEDDLGTSPDYLATDQSA